jgi:hypothetical protein
VEHSRGAKLTELVAEVDADRDDERSLPVSARR